MGLTHTESHGTLIASLRAGTVEQGAARRLDFHYPLLLQAGQLSIIVVLENLQLKQTRQDQGAPQKYGARQPLDSM